MLRLEKEQNNTIIYTATEKEGNHTSSTFDYLMKLINCQTQESLDVYLVDDSAYPDRYNQSTISLTTLLQADWNIDTITYNVLGSIKFVWGDVVIDTRSGRLTNNGTLVILGGGTITGPFINNGTLIQMEYGKSVFIDNNTFLFNMDYGYYDYEIYDKEGTTLLEIGNLLIGPYEPTLTQYTPVDTKKVYNG